MALHIRRAALPIFVALLVSATATGQTRSYAELRGLRMVTVFVESLSEADTKCGLAESTVETVAIKTLRDNRIPVAFSSTRLNVNISTLYLSPGPVCVSSVYAQLVEYARSSWPSYWTGERPAYCTLDLDSRAAIVASNPSRHGDRVAETLRKLAGEIAANIRLANQKPR